MIERQREIELSIVEDKKYIEIKLNGLTNILYDKYLSFKEFASRIHIHTHIQTQTQYNRVNVKISIARC